ncbi:MAG: type II secretion system protein [Phycisphaeraceae bacterium]|nr:type II secretion system protein [Phycisphaeraceae bacterium]
MGHRRAFTIIECLVVIGVVAILASLVVPALGKSRSRAMAVQALANIRSFGLGLESYASKNRDSVPVLYKPAWPAAGPFQLPYGTFGTGNWFEHARFFSLAVTTELDDIRIARAPGNPTAPTVYSDAGRPVSLSDYGLSFTLYATPRFFHPSTMSGVDQWAPQRLSSIVFPSDKGIMVQTLVYHFRELGVLSGCCNTNVPSPVLFADMSASAEDIGAMPRGVRNPFVPSTGTTSRNPFGLPGMAIMETLHGIAGRDRDLKARAP